MNKTTKNMNVIITLNVKLPKIESERKEKEYWINRRDKCPTV